jgi:hypothetical protein
MNPQYTVNALNFARDQLGMENNGRVVVSDFLGRIFEKDVNARLEDPVVFNPDFSTMKWTI